LANRAAVGANPDRAIGRFADGIDEIFIEALFLADDVEEARADLHQTAAFVAKPGIAVVVLIGEVHGVTGESFACG
jgi:hypothetical protein